MNDLARIAEIVHEHRAVVIQDYSGDLVIECGCGWFYTPEHHAEHVANVLDAALHPRIETVEQLDALPEGAVVRSDDDGGVYVKDHRYTLPNEPWWPAGYDVECGSAQIPLAARVLYTPEADR
ncbi:hypothetical protein ACRCUN_06115 [Mycobacterium sp. LTG2003]